MSRPPGAHHLYKTSFVSVQKHCNRPLVDKGGQSTHGHWGHKHIIGREVQTEYDLKTQTFL